MAKKKSKTQYEVEAPTPRPLYSEARLYYEGPDISLEDFVTLVESYAKGRKATLTFTPFSQPRFCAPIRIEFEDK